MSTEKVRGVVIREVPVGESDKIITLLTKEKGKITLSARGARKPKSKYLSSCELFACSDFVVYTARKYPSVASAVLIDSFYGLRKDIKLLAAASYLADFTNKMIFEGEDCGELALLLVSALKRLEKGGGDPLFLTWVFELKFFALNGMLPDFSNCMSCKRKAPEGGYFSGAGLICTDCAKGGEDENIKISSGAYKALNYIAGCDTPKAFSFEVSPKVKEQIKRVRTELFLSQVDTRFKTYDFLLSLYN